jgi:MFS family permease
MPMAMLSIVVLLLVRDRTGSYALAGTASAIASLTQAGVAPVIGRLVDRRSQTAVVPALLVLLLGGLTVLVVASVVDGPTWVMFAGAVVAGAGLLPYGALSRSRWAHLLHGDDRGMSTALALESIVDEGVFIIGPVVVTTLALVDPTLGAVAAGVFACVGTGLFLASPTTEPPPRRPGGGPAARRPRGLWVVVATSGLLGAVFGCIEVSTIAFAQLQGRAQFAGLLLGLVAVGSLAAGLWYGTRAWRWDLSIRYRVSLLTLGLGALPLLFVPSIAWMAPACLVLGLSIAPTLIASSSLIARLMPPALRTEGFSWHSSSINVGVAAGAALAGSLIEAVDVRAAFGAVPVTALVAVGVTAIGAGLLQPHAPEVGIDQLTV